MTDVKTNNTNSIDSKPYSRDIFAAPRIVKETASNTVGPIAKHLHLLDTLAAGPGCISSDEDGDGPKERRGSGELTFYEQLDNLDFT